MNLTTPMRKFLALALPFAVASVSSAQDVAYSNFGPGYSYNTSFGWAIAGPSTPNPQVIAQQFTAGNEGMIFDIKLPLADWHGGSLSMGIGLFHDSGGNTIGGGIAGWSFTLPVPRGQGIATIQNSFAGATLDIGSKYWLEVTTLNDGEHLWLYNDQAVTGLIASAASPGGSYSYSTGQPFGAFEVTVVPEPAGLAVVALGTLAVLCSRKR